MRLLTELDKLPMEPVRVSSKLKLFPATLLMIRARYVTHFETICRALLELASDFNDYSFNRLGGTIDTGNGSAMLMLALKVATALPVTCAITVIAEKKPR